MTKRKFMQHWPIMVLALVVVFIFLITLVAFEVKETEYAFILRFGKPKTHLVDGKEEVRIYKPGLHFKWPYPIEGVWRHDNRLHCFELTKGQVEQIQTADNYQVIVSTYVLWKVGDPALFKKRVGTTAEASSQLNDLVRDSRNTVLTQYKLTELINVDAKQLKIRDAEQDILEILADRAMKNYGIEVREVGFKHLGFPETVTTKVFERMRAERNRKSKKYRAEGKRDAQRIRARADLMVSQRLAEAEADAQRIRAEGDQKAAEYYAVFSSNPELAAFLRKLDSLRKTLTETTTLIVDTETQPFDLLRPGAIDLNKIESGAATQTKEEIAEKQEGENR